MQIQISAMELIVATLLLAALSNALPIDQETNSQEAKTLVEAETHIVLESKSDGDSALRGPRSLEPMRLIPVPRGYLEELADKAVELHEHLSVLLNMPPADDVMPMVISEHDQPIITLMTEDTQKQVLALQDKPLADAATDAAKPVRKPINPWSPPAGFSKPNWPTMPTRPSWTPWKPQTAMNEGAWQKQPYGNKNKYRCPSWVGEWCEQQYRQGR